MPKIDGHAELVKAMDGIAPVRIGDPQEAALAIFNRIAAAPDVETLLQLQGTLTADDVIGRPLNIVSVEFRKSDYEEGSPVYALIRAADENGEELPPITCGGTNVVTQLAVAQQKGFKLPLVKIIRTEKPTARGFYPLWLTAA